MDKYELRWTKQVQDVLVGRTIKRVSYLSKKEAEDLGWYHRSIALELDDGTVIWPSRDDEGNDAGALFTTNQKLEIIPVIPA